MPSKSEWRQDPLTERLVLISPERGERPINTSPACPFCEGHEGETPPEVLAYREPGSKANSPGWRVRVVPNRYAAVRFVSPLHFGEETGEGSLARASADHSPQPPPRSGEGEKTPGIGVAEVFIECPRHETKLRNLSATQVADVLRAWRDRVRHWQDDGRLAFVQIFRNEGPTAGSSVAHCHSQLIGIPFVPPNVESEHRHLALLQDFSSLCPYCRWLEDGQASERFVLESERFAAFCPLAPRFPGETWLLPKFHIHAFDLLSNQSLHELAGSLIDLAQRIDRVFDDPAFNLILKLPPLPISDRFHWRLELLPRTTTTAGWEWGTGLLINTMFPEEAARLLREQ